MAIGTPALLQSRNPNLTGQGTLVFTIGATGAAIGDLVYITGGFGLGSSPSITVTDSKGNTWTLNRRDDKTTTQTPHSFVASAVLTTALVTSDTITVTFGSNVNYPQGSAYKATGSWDGSREDQENGATGAAATSLSSGNITTTVNDELIVGSICFGIGGISNYADTAGNTAQDGITATSKSSVNTYRIVSSTGTYSVAGTMTSCEFAVSVVSFKEAAAAGGGRLLRGGALVRGGNLIKGKLAA